jgi:hypothetical protein
MSDSDADVEHELVGVWELWMTQDRSRPESQSPFAWINPLENQSYSNNPGGRSNLLPRDSKRPRKSWHHKYAPRRPQRQIVCLPSVRVRNLLI